MAGIKQVLDMADAAAKAGDVDRAIGLYRQILTKVPKHTKAKKALARLQKQGGGTGSMTQADARALVQILNSGNFAAAKDAANQLSQRFPNEPFVFNILGYTCGMLGDQKEAIAAYKWALKLNPNFIEAMSNYGSYLVQIGKLDEAIVLLTKAVAKKPDYAEAHHNLGVAYFTQGAMQDALSHYNTALKLVPKYANALSSRGSLRASMKDTQGAIEDFEAALVLSPRDADVLSKLGNMLAGFGNPTKGLELLEKAVSVNPNDVDKHLRFATALTEAGEATKALAAFKELLKVSPNHAQAQRQIADILPKGDVPDFTKNLEQQFQAKDCTDDDKVHLGFALGYLYEKAKQVEESYRCLNIANSTYRSSMPPLPETDAKKFERITKDFESHSYVHLEGTHQSDTPIFIVGLMRSGTSLVEQIIATHSQVYGAGELTDITELSEPIYKAGRRATTSEAMDFAETYLSRLCYASDGAKRCVDKMPANFFNVGLIKTIFPNAKIINMVRDPRDNCFSIYKNFFDTYAHQYAYDQAELATFANSYKRMMNMWDDLFPGAVYHVKYESLVSNQEGESRKLLDHLGLNWEDQVLDFHKTKRAVRTASVNQVRQKVYTSSVKSWQNYAPYLGTLFGGLDKELWADTFVD